MIFHRPLPGSELGVPCNFPSRFLLIGSWWSVDLIEPPREGKISITSLISNSTLFLNGNKALINRFYELLKHLLKALLPQISTQFLEVLSVNMDVRVISHYFSRFLVCCISAVSVTTSSFRVLQASNSEGSLLHERKRRQLLEVDYIEPALWTNCFRQYASLVGNLRR